MSAMPDLKILRLEMIEAARKIGDEKQIAELFALTEDQFELWWRATQANEGNKL